MTAPNAPLLGVDPRIAYGPEVLEAMLPPGQEFVIPTTTRIYDQGAAETCCANTVGAAMETRWVGSNGLSPASGPIDPSVIFQGARRKRDLFNSRSAAKAGIVTALGIERATSSYKSTMTILQMVSALKNGQPLMIEAKIGSNFSSYVGASVYRSEGPRSLHAMCIIGYGTDAITFEPYWKVKNSYGAAWGESGYGRLLWGDANIEAELTVHLLESVEP